MYNSSDQFYTGPGYYNNNPDWHQADATFKADLLFGFIEQFQLSTARVVEVGCGAGGILVELAKKIKAGSILKGYDISPQAIHMAKEKETSQISFYQEDYTRLVTEKADLVLVMDVVEHIDDVYSFLRKIRDKGQHYIFHIPLDLSCRTILKPHIMLQQRTSVGHIHYFTEETALWMLQDTGFTVKHFVYTKADIDLLRPASFKQWVKKLLRKMSFFLNKKLSVKLWGGYSLLILAKPTATSNEKSIMAL